MAEPCARVCVCVGGGGGGSSIAFEKLECVLVYGRELTCKKMYLFTAGN